MQDRALYRTRKGWTIAFQPNVHMYAHSLQASKNGRTYQVPCEDTPDGYVGIWPYQLGLDPPVLQDLMEGLREWAAHQWAGRPAATYRLYGSSGEFETGGRDLLHSLRDATLILLLVLALASF